ncbi:MAG: signal peptidase I, partial [Acidimicrobiia bacterium]
MTALVIAVLIKTFLVQPFWIPSESMLPTIEVNDRVMVNKLAFNWGEPERGDIVVFRDTALQYWP